MPVNLISAGGGTTTLTPASSASNYTVTLPASTGTVLTTTAPKTGNVIQVVSTTLTTTFSAAPSSNAFTDITGLSASITPSSASNKIMVFISVTINSGTVDGAPFRLVRSGTPIGNATVVGSRLSAMGMSASTVTNASQGSYAGTFLDSPATTSAITYQVQGTGHNTGSTFYVNRSATFSDSAIGYNATTSSTITVMEIAG